MTINPTTDHILIEEWLPPATVSKIITPDKYKKDPHWNKVLAVGPGRFGFKDELLPMPCKKDDIILALRNTGTPLEVEGVKYRMIQSDSVMAVVIP